MRAILALEVGRYCEAPSLRRLDSAGSKELTAPPPLCCVMLILCTCSLVHVSQVAWRQWMFLERVWVTYVCD